MSEWTAIHLFVARPRDLDVLALRAAMTIGRAGRQNARWFFVRYNERGVHLRVRIGGLSRRVTAEILETLAEECSRLASLRRPTSWIAAAGIPDRDGRVAPPGHAIQLPYEPETVRYAGPDALLVSEDVFCVSSALAARTIGGTINDRRSRNLIAAALMPLTLRSLLGNSETRSNFFLGYAAAWERLEDRSTSSYLSQRILRRWTGADTKSLNHDLASIVRNYDVSAWIKALNVLLMRAERLHAAGKLISPSTGLVTATDDDLSAALEQLAGSHIHMMNNRLGIWPDGEIAIARALAGHV